MNKISLIIVIVVLFSCCSKRHIPRQDLLLSIKSNSAKPDDYVIQKFADHQVIFIGENHFIREQVAFIASMIPKLYDNGIYNLGSEFIRYSDTELLNSAITAKVYDEELVKEITFRSLWHWGYKEYLDIYKAAWKLNKSLPAGAPKFRIFGIEEDTDFSFIKSAKDYEDPEIMKKVFISGGDFDEQEGYSAYAIQKEVLDKDQKALIHCGYHHAFTSYYQPFVNEGQFISQNKERVGNLVKNKIKEKAFSIFIHSPWYSEKGYAAKQVLPVQGVLDSMFSLPENKYGYPFGMDTKGTLLGSLKGENSIYKYGHENFGLSDFCDGYIFLKPMKEYKVVSAIPGFVRPEHVEYIKQQELDFRGHDLTAENLNDTIQIWLDKVQTELLKME